MLIVKIISINIWEYVEMITSTHVLHFKFLAGGPVAYFHMEVIVATFMDFLKIVTRMAILFIIRRSFSIKVCRKNHPG